MGTLCHKQVRTQTHTYTHARVNKRVCVHSEQKQKQNIFFNYYFRNPWNKGQAWAGFLLWYKGISLLPFTLQVCKEGDVIPAHPPSLSACTSVTSWSKKQEKIENLRENKQERELKERCVKQTHTHTHISIPGIGAWNIEPSYFLKVVINVMPHPRSSPRHFHPTNGRILLALH